MSALSSEQPPEPDDLPPPTGGVASSEQTTGEQVTSGKQPPRLFCHEPPVLDFDTLAGPRGELVVLHNGRRYRLIATRKGGLLLNR